MTRRHLLAMIAGAVVVPMTMLVHRAPRFVASVDLEVLPDGTHRPTGRGLHFFLDGREISEADFWEAASLSSSLQMRGWAAAQVQA